MPNKKTSGPDYLDYTGQEELNAKLRKRRKSKDADKKRIENAIKKKFRELQKPKSSNIA
tara:strand:+ start:423 stop:599 length:177 start_codon:yes stop_codon:yes gene_type:complete